MTRPAAEDQIAAFEASLAGDAPPAGLDTRLGALWHAAKGNFDRANQLLAKDASAEAAWVRAHIHRRRGEDDEAAGWYERAGRDVPHDPVSQEWAVIAGNLLVHI